MKNKNIQIIKKVILSLINLMISNFLSCWSTGGRKNKLMKRIIFSIVFVCTGLSCFSQTLDGYRYLYLPPLKYMDGSMDKYGIAREVSLHFKRLGFIIATSENQLPNYLSCERNSILFCNIEQSWDDIVYASTEITITLTNILKETVLTLNNNGKALSNKQDAVNRALRNMFEPVDNITYNFNPDKMPQEKLPIVEKTTWDEPSIRYYLDTCTSLSDIEGIYKSVKSENTGYYKIGIIREGYVFKAIVIESDNCRWNEGEVKAVFEKANMSLYSVSFYMALKNVVETFATYDTKGLLVVDFEKFRKEGHNTSFIKLYPINQQTPPKVSIPRPSNQYIASGTGFFISKDGYIATNAHVIKGGNRFTVGLLKDDKIIQYKADVIVTDAANDVAIIKIEDENFVSFNKLPYTIESNINIGAEVYTIGFPLNDVMGSNYKVTNGIISSKTGMDDDIRKYQITVPIQPGNSGGPLINKNGNIVGITSSSLNGDAIGTKVENVNYAVKSLYLLNAINMVPKIEKLPIKSSIADKSMEEQIKVLKNFICLIRVYYVEN